MKTYHRLYPQVYDFANLYTAYLAARKGKRRKAHVAAFEHNQEDELFLLQDELRQYSYGMELNNYPVFFSHPTPPIEIGV